jgi:cell division protein FtsA
VEEILGHVQQRLRASGYDVAVGRRAVLTGGGSQLAGVRDLAERVLNKQVRLGRPPMFPGLPAAAGPDYATAVGLLMAGASMAPETLNPEVTVDEPEQVGGWFGQLTRRLLK